MPTSYDWDDPQLRDASTFDNRNYKLKRGYRDVLRIVSSCDEVFVHGFKLDGKFNRRVCARNKGKKCAWCENAKKLPDHNRRLQFGTVVLHVATIPIEGGKPRKVLKCLAWRFSDDKKNRLMEVAALLGAGGTLRKTDLMVSLESQTAKAEHFQDANIDASPKNFLEIMKKKFPDEVQDAMNGVDGAKAQLFPSYEDSLSEYERALNAGEFDPTKVGDDDEDEVDVEDAFGDDDDTEDEFEDETEEEEEEGEDEEWEEEEEVEEKPKKKKKKSKKKAAKKKAKKKKASKKKSSKKKAKKEEEEDESWEEAEDDWEDDEEGEDPLEGMFDD